jgi:hypothetical protein
VALTWQVLEVVVDASNVPGEYALTILSECAAFPRRLVFFLKGSLTVSASPVPCSAESAVLVWCMLLPSFSDPLPLQPRGQSRARASAACPRLPCVCSSARWVFRQPHMHSRVAAAL